MFVRYLGGGLYHTILRGIIDITDSLREILGSRVADADDSDSSDDDDGDDSSGDSDEGDGGERDVEMVDDEEEGEEEEWNEAYEDGDWDALRETVEEWDSDDSSGNVDTDDEDWVIGL